MQQTTCKLKMAKCNWNVINLNNSKKCEGEKGQDYFLWITIK